MYDVVPWLAVDVPEKVTSAFVLAPAADPTWIEWIVLPAPLTVTCTLSTPAPRLVLTSTGGRGEQATFATAAAALTRPFAQIVPVPAIGSAGWSSPVTIARLDDPYLGDQSSAAPAQTCGVPRQV